MLDDEVPELGDKALLLVGVPQLLLAAWNLQSDTVDCVTLDIIWCVLRSMYEGND